MAAALEAAGARHRFLHYTYRGHMPITDAVIAASQAFIGEVEARQVR